MILLPGSLYSLSLLINDVSLSSSTKPTNLSTICPFLNPITVGTAWTPWSNATSPRSSISTMARSTSSSAVAIAASSLKDIILQEKGRQIWALPWREQFAGATPGGGEVHYCRLLTVHHFLTELLLALDLERGHRVSGGGHVPRPGPVLCHPVHWRQQGSGWQHCDYVNWHNVDVALHLHQSSCYFVETHTSEASHSAIKVQMLSVVFHKLKNFSLF